MSSSSNKTNGQGPSHNDKLENCNFLTAYAPKVFEACLAQVPPVTTRDGFFDHILRNGGNVYSESHLRGQIYDFLNGDMFEPECHVSIATLTVIHNAFGLPFNNETFASALAELRDRYPEGNHRVLEYFSESAQATTRSKKPTKPPVLKPAAAPEIREPQIATGTHDAALEKWNPILTTVTEQIRDFKSKRQMYPSSWGAAPDDVGKHLLQLIRQMMSEGIVTMVGVPDAERKNVCARAVGHSDWSALNSAAKRDPQTPRKVSAALTSLLLLDAGGRLVPGSFERNVSATNMTGLPGGTLTFG